MTTTQSLTIDDIKAAIAAENERLLEQASYLPSDDAIRKQTRYLKNQIEQGKNPHDFSSPVILVSRTNPHLILAEFDTAHDAARYCGVYVTQIAGFCRYARPTSKNNFCGGFVAWKWDYLLSIMSGTVRESQIIPSTEPTTIEGPQNTDEGFYRHYEIDSELIAYLGEPNETRASKTYPDRTIGLYAIGRVEAAWRALSLWYHSDGRMKKTHPLRVEKDKYYTDSELTFKGIRVADCGEPDAHRPALRNDGRPVKLFLKTRIDLQFQKLKTKVRYQTDPQFRREANAFNNLLKKLQQQ